MAEPAARDPEFERTLERLFAEPPAFTDADAFARKVKARMARNWRVRTLGIGVAGVAGGVVAASQIVCSGPGAGPVAIKLQIASAQSAQAADAVYRQTWSGLNALSHVTPSAGLFWAVSGLMILAAVIGATRVLDEV
jgi:hypothetical protein